MRIWNAVRYFLGGQAQRAVFAQLALFLLLCGLTGALWSFFRPQILSQEVYQLSAANFRVWNPPPWIPDNFVEEALGYIPTEERAKGLNALNPGLVDSLVRAFSNNPRVASVESIVVSYPATVDVALKFKTPAAFFDPDETGRLEQIQDFRTLFPEDEFLERLELETSFEPPDPQGGTAAAPETTLLDGEGESMDDSYFRKNKKERELLPTVKTYGPYGDFSAKAAAFAAFLESFDAVRQFGIETIHAFKTLGETEPTFFISTREGRVVYWGRFDAPQNYSFGGILYDGVSRRRTAPEEKKAIYAYQRQKLNVWRKLNKTSNEVAFDLSKAAKERAEKK